jgi:predicted transcriptional regulator
MSMNLKEAYDFYQGVRLSEVAKTLDVSEAFVSQVLSGKRSSASVTTELRQRIENRISELRNNLCQQC